MTEQQGGQQPAAPQQPTPQQPAKKTSTGLEENVAGLLCYVLWWVTGVIFFFIEPQNKFVRFHAIQSICVFGFFWLLGMIFIWVPFVYWIIWLVGVIFWIILMVKAYQGQIWKFPVAGNFAEKHSQPKAAK